MTSPSRSESNTQSYFVGLLAEQARLTENAAPADLKLLTEKLTYLTDEQIKLITSAHAYASRAHDGQWRRTGHEYISHPTAVASILADMRMDHQTLMAALLHDVIEDSSTSKSSLGDQFGRPVAEIVDGVSKLTKIFFQPAQKRKQRTFKKWLWLWPKIYV